MSTILEFATSQQAIAWMLVHLEERGDEYIDNERFAFLDDHPAQAQYDQQQATGCCGFFDTEVIVAARRARVGCNYGH